MNTDAPQRHTAAQKRIITIKNPPNLLSFRCSSFFEEEERRSKGWSSSSTTIAALFVENFSTRHSTRAPARDLSLSLSLCVNVISTRFGFFLFCRCEEFPTNEFRKKLMITIVEKVHTYEKLKRRHVEKVSRLCVVLDRFYNCYNFFSLHFFQCRCACRLGRERNVYTFTQTHENTRERLTSSYAFAVLFSEEEIGRRRRRRE